MGEEKLPFVEDGIGEVIARGLDGASSWITPGSRIRVVTGAIDGVHVRVEYKFGNRSRLWIVTSKLGKGAPPLLVEAWKRRVGEGGVVARGGVTPVATGDEAFDEEWLVEGVPAEAARAIFDAETREAIGRVGEFVLGVEDGVVTASVNGDGASGLAAIERGLDVVLVVRRRVAGLPKPTGADLARARAEVEALKRRREALWARLTLPQRIVTATAFTILVLGIAAGVFYGCGLDALTR